MTTPLPADSDEQYQALQAIYLTWHDGKRPLSGFIREVQAIIAEKERVAEIKSEKLHHQQLEQAKTMVVKYSNEHEALGIGWVISGIDRMAYDSGKRIKQLKDAADGHGETK